MARKAQVVESIYSVSPGVAMVQKWIAGLKEKTGRSLDEWLQFINAEGPPGEKERRDWLKQEHGLGTNAAWWLAERSLGKGTEEDDPEAYLRTAEKYVADLFAGPKTGLWPIYEEVLKRGRNLGTDVRICPCKTMVPFYRNHVFAQVKPATRTRIDFGFALGDTKATGRLIDTGGFAKKDRITHRIPLTSLADLDAEFEHWLQVAYDRDA
jgi:hypothetical protein